MNDRGQRIRADTSGTQAAPTARELWEQGLRVERDLEDLRDALRQAVTLGQKLIRSRPAPTVRDPAHRRRVGYVLGGGLPRYQCVRCSDSVAVSPTVPSSPGSCRRWPTIPAGAEASRRRCTAGHLRRPVLPTSRPGNPCPHAGGRVSGTTTPAKCPWAWPLLGEEESFVGS